MEDVEIPSYFLCPISLQLMRDPVTLTTGITYDRESIERWLFSGNHDTCPMTKQSLPNSDLTPNHTLRRLIQAWCITNSSSGVDRIPTPRIPVDRAHISNLLQEANSNRTACLQKLGQIVSESDANRRCVESDSGAVEFLASVIQSSSSSSSDEDDSIESAASRSACEEALSILRSLQISEQRLLRLVAAKGGFIDCLFTVLQQSSYRSRAYATLLLKSIVSSVSPIKLASVGEEQLHEIVNVVSDRVSIQATKAALHVLIGLCPWGRNRIKAVNAGAVPVLIDLLLEDTDKRICELALVALERLCGCAEGRAVLVGHAAGVAVVSKKILRVSAVASERAVRILEKVAKLSATADVLQEMLQVGVVSKLCLVLEVDCGVKEKERAREILRLHAGVWRKSPCLSPQILISYPPS